MSAHNIGVSRHSVLPPIVPESDKKFLDSIQGYIITEIEKVGCTEQGPAEDYYIIYCNVFDKIIEHVTVYKNILTSIKQEYDAFIEAIKKGQRNAFYLHGKLKVLASEPTTLKYYRKRTIQLEDKIKVIERNSARIQNLILKIRNIKKVPSTEVLTPRKKINPAKPIPGLTVKESLSLDALSRHLAQLEGRVQELKADMISKYIPLENKAGLEQELKHSLELRDKAEAVNEKLRLSYNRITLVANAVSAWAKSDKSTSLQELLSQVMEKKEVVKAAAAFSISHIFEHDPSKSKEAEDLLEYIERFNELFSYGQYEAAAVYAANCPRGILRNEETMMKFKALGAVKGRILPLLRYFEALISSSAAVKHPLCAAMTLEAIKCALFEKQLNLVMHWVTQQRLTFCEAVGDVIYDYGEVEPFNKSKCLALAQIAYSQCGVHKKAALCLCKQGQICGAMDYIQQFKQLTLDDYLFLLKNCPSIELIHCLTQEWNEKPALLSIGATILSLIETDHKEHGLQLLEEINMGEKNALEQVILNDMVCTLEGWKNIADTCAENKHEKLSQEILSILTSQEGVVQISPFDDDDDVKIMEHVFL
ncbi:clathrin heavy chain linker domain-containing protein 1 isoform X1 [Malaclemys terrapin pileata]|uniref:clathrin heavy chain linker domain-containing protein 1 isoform X1 n=1 Tax=Malaclemys terrapin pileata TaxID=2991368 RepID=UPI0023A84942|nr:clathrin heavy chain linker domain-containing protein 1 isoform X1 [Malaclemys terrapin pileata]XP_053878493.1 clathrin heavy chain linker domain-containing protein 1 isoform X1 [Malaclemys terrapin pileata]XP_053878494.1 clathrin heavy chain linker domain-containing protein 1 isoform X1 [Malaclemys terrapin pileata]XP_053878495.1 clathrin heavy chain linker domain-containing protein 1 isoform X1 [Malaclemys terrapin pileata]